MTRARRYQINVAICVLVTVHAAYWFFSGQMATATGLRTGLVVAQAVLGCIGIVWFWQRARTADRS